MDVLQLCFGAPLHFWYDAMNKEREHVHSMTLQWALMDLCEHVWQDDNAMFMHIQYSIVSFNYFAPSGECYNTSGFKVKGGLLNSLYIK